MNGLDGHLWDKSVRSIFWNSDGRVCDAAGVRTLEEAFKKAYSIENMAGHNADDQETEYIGTVQRGKRLYQIHKGKRGDYWYRVMVKEEEEIVSEKRAVFGKRWRRR